MHGATLPPQSRWLAGLGIAAMAVAGLLLLPDPVVAKLPSWVVQHCTVAVLILLGWMLRLSSRRAAEQELQAAPAPAT